MRLLSLFFAFYFACLSTMTCTDEVPVSQDQAHTTIAAASHADGGTDALGDWCSPLCQCHCCPGVVMPVPATPVLPQAALPDWSEAQRHAFLVVAAPTRASGAVWQPPQA
ncbi:hypothetical protein HNQ93_004124 [Hymenobacter luteus]|uniref:DUF2946 domain-containing protein n=2 Tax=Hymenobacter TaxID=89966 RepID=A0A7W9T5D1_9BACT|nr:MULTISPECIES: DUF6660 family protein [Hymenobacter]MBB4603582.1 hypothetical protein [Hymenobacter latericoloratus]MBB6061245.1 hypothetical protein [Hymenobacter luteus]MCC3160153.1 hypothetical protein [Hymenobacter sp. 15J16-1T3B]UYZ61294.1 hypothetical protein OIS50_20185 [Hymenobacter sp. YIM 151858-1]